MWRLEGSYLVPYSAIAAHLISDINIINCVHVHSMLHAFGTNLRPAMEILRYPRQRERERERDAPQTEVELSETLFCALAAISINLRQSRRTGHFPGIRDRKQKLVK